MNLRLSLTVKSRRSSTPDGIVARHRPIEVFTGEYALVTVIGASRGVLRSICCSLSRICQCAQRVEMGSSIPLPSTLPGIEAGVRGMRFIERVIESNRREGWVVF
jgi:hypothetical protein